MIKNESDLKIMQESLEQQKLMVETYEKALRREELIQSDEVLTWKIIVEKEKKRLEAFEKLIEAYNAR